MKQIKRNKDELAKEYFCDEKVFADLANLSLYQGKQIIHPEQLKELDSVMMQKRRDVLKKWITAEGNEMFLGIEVQAVVDPSMPVRIMEYDVTLYKRQIKLKQQEHDRRKLQKGEFLSGIRSTDRLHPIITMVVNLSGEKWNGAKSLNEILDYQGQANDYEIKMIDPQKITEKELNSCRSEVRKLIRVMASAQKKEDLNRCLQRKEYQEVESKTAQMIWAFTNMEIPLNNKEGEKQNMCKAMEELKMDWKEIGKKEEKIRTAEKMLSDGLSDELIGKYVDLSANTIRELRKKLIGA